MGRVGDKTGESPRRLGPAPVKEKPARDAARPIVGAQQVVGNQAVLGLLRGSRMPAGLRISGPDDPSEREADRVAERVSRGPASPDRALAHVLQRGGAGPGQAPLLQRQAKPFVIRHMSGSEHEVPGLAAGETEFGASGATSSLLTPGTRRAGHPITGGFGTDLEVDVAYATGVETVKAKEVTALIKAAGKRVDKRLVAALTVVAEDRFVFTALKTFLQKDKGTLEAWDNDSGHYDAKSPPTISVGITGGDLDTRTTLVHELLHYVFDKVDSVLSESKDPGGADHPAIQALEARFLIIHLIRSGEPPLHDKIEDQFGRFLKGTDYFPKMKEAIGQDKPADLDQLVSDPDFVRTTVSSGLLPVASGLKFTGKDRYTPANEQLRDLAFLWAQNAVIVRHAMKRAAALATKNGVTLKDVFKSTAWRDEMKVFLESFVKGLRKDRTKGVVSLEATL